MYVEHKKFEYSGGKKYYFDYLDSDEISLIELAAMVKQLGYSKNSTIWCHSWSERKINPKLLSSDGELIDLIGKISKKKRGFLSASYNTVKMTFNS
jgi:hypothetical protein